MTPWRLMEGLPLPRQMTNAARSDSTDFSASAAELYAGISRLTQTGGRASGYTALMHSQGSVSRRTNGQKLSVVKDAERAGGSVWAWAAGQQLSSKGACGPQQTTKSIVTFPQRRNRFSLPESTAIANGRAG